MGHKEHWKTSLPDTFIEFGLSTCLTYIKAAKARGYRTIAIDKTTPKILLESPDYYNLIVDETYIGCWSEKFDIPLANSWVCDGCLEHTPKDIVKREVKGIRDKVCGPGNISIDLSDHGGHTVFSKINGILHDEWEDIISQYFDYELESHKEMMYFWNCTPKDRLEDFFA